MVNSTTSPAALGTTGVVDLFLTSLVTNAATFLSVFCLAYAVAFPLRQGDTGGLVASLKQFKINPKYPPLALVWVEFRRCCCSILIVSCYDTALTKLGATVGVAPPALVAASFSLEGLAGLVFGTLDSGWGLARILGVLVALVLWADLHFYWTHRLLHEVKWLYKNVHKIHHESYNPDPMSGLSFHPIEGAIYFSSLLGVSLICQLLAIVLPAAIHAAIFPLPRFHYAVFRTLLILAPVGGHFGHSDSQFAGGYWGGFEHYLHHTKFNYNFGSGILPHGGIWDNVCGTLIYIDPADGKTLRTNGGGLSGLGLSGKGGKGGAPSAQAKAASERRARAAAEQERATIEGKKD